MDVVDAQQIAGRRTSMQGYCAGDGPGGSLPAGVERSGSSSIKMSATRAPARKIQAEANTQRNTSAAAAPLALMVEATADTAAPRCGVTPRPASRIAPMT